MLLTTPQCTGPKYRQPRKSLVHRSQKPAWHGFTHLSLEQLCEAETTVIHSQKGRTKAHRGFGAPSASQASPHPGWDGADSPQWTFFAVMSLNTWGFPDSSAGKESVCNGGNSGSIPGLGRSAGEGIGYPLQYSWASLVAQLVKNLPARQETWVQSLGWKDPLEKGKATHSSILAWRIPWTV